MIRKESRRFNISVEGINCEKMYFEHLAKLINNSGRNTYNLKVDPRKMSPMEYAKRNAHRPVETRKGKKLPYIHVQDIEDYYDDYQKAKFYGMIDDMRMAEDKFKITYKLGYSNYTFELWMLLHVADMPQAVQNRRAYLALVNRWFQRRYTDLDEFKSANEFQGVLDEFVTIDSVKKAVRRAEKIVEQNARNHKVKENYKGFTFYHDNPDMSVHDVVKLIFDVCKVR